MLSAFYVLEVFETGVRSVVEAEPTSKWDQIVLADVRRNLLHRSVSDMAAVL
jgi:hypothetical protein